MNHFFDHLTNHFDITDDLLPYEMVGTYDVSLVGLSYFIAVIGAYGMLRAVERTKAFSGSELSVVWLGAATISMGCGVWGMHFTGMLAFSLPTPINYVAWITAASVLPALVASGSAARMIGAQETSFWSMQIAALLLASGIGMMHYSGMAAMVMDGVMRYELDLFIVSILVAYALSWTALQGVTRVSAKTTHAESNVATLIGSLILGSAVTVMHYTGMAAAHYYAIGESHTDAGFPVELLIPMIVAGVLVIVAMIVYGSFIDKRLDTTIESLRSVESLNRAVVENMQDAQLVTSTYGIVQSFNPAAEKMFGYSADEVVGQNVNILMSELYSPAHDEHLSQYRETRTNSIIGNKRQLIDGACRKNGEKFSIELMVSDFVSNNARYFSATIRDVTKRLMAERQLDQMAAAVRFANETILIVDENDRVGYVNPNWEERYGRSLEDVAGQEIATLFSKKRQLVFDEIKKTIRQGKPWSKILTNEDQNNDLIEEEASAAPILDEAGRLTSYVVICRDITERSRLERELAQAQKLDSIGQLAAGIAHEINTPIQYVGDNLRFLEDSFSELHKAFDQVLEVAGPTASKIYDQEESEYFKEEVPKALKQSIDGVTRVTNIVRAMKEFSHPGHEKVSIDLNRAVESTATVATSEWKYVAELELDLDPNLPEVTCLPGDINQVLLNLIVNAAHAIGDVVGDSGEKGTITVRTIKRDNWVDIQVSDTGCGIPNEIKNRIFDPFFTTKEVGVGTGQGLALSYSIVTDKHKGHLSVKNNQGKGATFTISLPLEETAQNQKVA